MSTTISLDFSKCYEYQSRRVSITRIKKTLLGVLFVGFFLSLPISAFTAERAIYDPSNGHVYIPSIGVVGTDNVIEGYYEVEMIPHNDFFMVTKVNPTENRHVGWFYPDSGKVMLFNVHVVNTGYAYDVNLQQKERLTFSVKDVELSGIPYISGEEFTFFEWEMVGKWRRYHAYDDHTDYMIFKADGTACAWEDYDGSRRDYRSYTNWGLDDKERPEGSTVFDSFRGAGLEVGMIYKSIYEYHYIDDVIKYSRGTLTWTRSTTSKDCE